MMTLLLRTAIKFVATVTIVAIVIAFFLTVQNARDRARGMKCYNQLMNFSGARTQDDAKKITQFMRNRALNPPTVTDKSGR